MHLRACIRLVPLLAAWVAVTGLSPAAGDAPDAVVEAVSSSLEIERRLLEEDIVAHRQLAARRTDVVNRLGRLYRSLDSAVHGEEAAGGAERLDVLIEQVERAEGDRSALLTAEHVLVDRIRDRHRRIQLLEQRIAELEGRQTEQRTGVLTGTWEMVLMPYGQRGIAELEQTGTLVNGTYRLEGGADGSLQGTLVNRKVYLVRIDSRLGKSMELEGQLSADGDAIRGSWLNFELAGGEGGTGHWSARRRTDEAAGSR